MDHESKEKKIKPSFTGKKRANLREREECSLKAEVINEKMQENCTPFDMFRKVTNFDELINLIVVQSNLYTQQNGCEFQRNVKEMTAFSSINYIMNINHPPAAQSYWECGKFTEHEGVRNTMTRQRFKGISRKWSSISKYCFQWWIAKCWRAHDKIQRLLFNETVRQEKTNQVKLQILVSLCSATGYLYQLELYLGKKDEVELNLFESVVLKMCRVLEKTYCTVYFDNFNSLLLISKPIKKGIYRMGTAQSNWKAMPVLPSDKKIKRRFRLQIFHQLAVVNGWITGPWWCYLFILKECRPSHWFNTDSMVQQQRFLYLDLTDQGSGVYHLYR